MRIFVDVGAHEGQTLQEAVKPEYGFDRILAVEPMPAQAGQLILSYAHDPRVEFHAYALTDQSGLAELYGTNDILEASIFPTKEDVDATIVTQVPAMRATEFFLRLPSDAEVFVKINAEGAEVPILLDLVHSGAIWRISHLLVSFDIGKVPGHEAEEQLVRNRLADTGFTRYTDQWPTDCTHQEAIGRWLRAVMAP